jgi:uncharacterized protein YceK
VKTQVGIGFAFIALSLTGCGSVVTLTNTSPTRYVSQTATYRYSLKIQSPSATCQFPGFMLSSDSGFDNGLGGTGTVQLIPGKYTGVSGYEFGTGFYWIKERCKWTLTLAP